MATTRQSLSKPPHLVRFVGDCSCVYWRFKRWECLGLVAEKIEQVPLRYESNELTFGFSSAKKMGTDVALLGDIEFQRERGIRLTPDSFEQPMLATKFLRRSVDDVAADITQEVGMFLKHDDFDAGQRVPAENVEKSRRSGVYPDHLGHSV